MLLAHKLCTAVTADFAKRVVGVHDAPSAVGNRYDGMQIERGKQGVTVAQGGLQILRHAVRQIFCATASAGLLAQHGCQKGADQSACTKQQQGEGQVDRRIKRRGAIHGERHAAPRQLQGFAQGVAVACGRVRPRRMVTGTGVRIKHHHPAARINGGIHNLEIEQA